MLAYFRFSVPASILMCNPAPSSQVGLEFYFVPCHHSLATSNTLLSVSVSQLKVIAQLLSFPSSSEQILEWKSGAWWLPRIPFPLEVWISGLQGQGSTMITSKWGLFNCACCFLFAPTLRFVSMLQADLTSL